MIFRPISGSPDKIKRPASSSPSSSSLALHIIPSDATPLSLDFLILNPPGNLAPGRATGTRSPGLKLVAPQTIWAGASAPTSTEQTLNRSASGCWFFSRTLPTTTLSRLTDGPSSPSSTSMPSIGSTSISSSAGSGRSTYCDNQSRLIFIPDWRTGIENVGRSGKNDGCHQCRGVTWLPVRYRDRMQIQSILPDLYQPAPKL